MSSNLERVGVSECLGLLGSVPVGRIAVSERAIPAILPVNFVVFGDSIVVRTAAGGPLARAVSGSVVAFEVDGFDRFSKTGWSVLVVGHARLVVDTDEYRALSRLDLTPWAGGTRDAFILIGIERLSGRRLTRARREVTA